MVVVPWGFNEGTGGGNPRGLDSAAVNSTGGWPLQPDGALAAPAAAPSRGRRQLAVPSPAPQILAPRETLGLTGGDVTPRLLPPPVCGRGGGAARAPGAGAAAAARRPQRRGEGGRGAEQQAAELRRGGRDGTGDTRDGRCPPGGVAEALKGAVGEGPAPGPGQLRRQRLRSACRALPLAGPQPRRESRCFPSHTTPPHTHTPPHLRQRTGPGS